MNHTKCTTPPFLGHRKPFGVQDASSHRSCMSPQLLRTTKTTRSVTKSPTTMKPPVLVSFVCSLHILFEASRTPRFQQGSYRMFTALKATVPLTTRSGVPRRRRSAKIKQSFCCSCFDNKHSLYTKDAEQSYMCHRRFLRQMVVLFQWKTWFGLELKFPG